MRSQIRNQYITLDILQKNYIHENIEEYPNTVEKNISHPRISVIFITYNHKRFIEESLQGVLSQKTDFDFEILIGDDESTDGTREICIEYAKKNPEKIKLFLHKRKNNIEILGRPCGIFQYIYNMLHTRGKYIAVCSGDDVWTDASKLQKQYNFLSSYPGYSMVYQLWKEKIVGKDNTFKLKTPKRTSKKPSTALFMNFKGEMPIQMLHVIQEDIFGWFILRSKGIFFCIKELSPVIINTPEESMMRSLSSLSRFEHVLNFKRKLYQSYKVSDRKQEAINEYMGIVGVIFKSNNRIKLKIIIIALKNIIKDGLLIDLIKNIFFKNNKV